MDGKQLVEGLRGTTDTKVMYVSWKGERIYRSARRPPFDSWYAFQFDNTLRLLLSEIEGPMFNLNRALHPFWDDLVQKGAITPAVHKALTDIPEREAKRDVILYRSQASQPFENQTIDEVQQRYPESKVQLIFDDNPMSRFREVIQQAMQGKIECLGLAPLNRKGRAYPLSIETFLCLARHETRLFIPGFFDSSTVSSFWGGMSTVLLLLRQRHTLLTSQGQERARGEGKRIGRPPVFTEEDKLRCWELRSKGCSLREIGRQIKASTSSVSRTLHELHDRGFDHQKYITVNGKEQPFLLRGKR